MAHVPRIYVPGPISAGTMKLPPAASHHLATVLRGRIGDDVLVFAGDGREYGASVSSVTKAGVSVTVGFLVRQEPLPQVSVTLWMGMIRPQRAELALEKAVEAGADVFQPLVIDHAMRGYAEVEGRMERWQRIGVEASEQSGRLYLPVIRKPAALGTVLAEPVRRTVLFAHPGGMPFSEAKRFLPAAGDVAIAVGSEGGFSEAEVALARAKGAIAVSLGPNILRTETAAIVAVALLRAG